MPKIVSVETLKKQENDFITRVVLANLVQSRDQPVLTCTPRLRFSRMRRRKSPLLAVSIFQNFPQNAGIFMDNLCKIGRSLMDNLGEN
jgi:hypothetical protein